MTQPTQDFQTQPAPPPVPPQTVSITDRILIASELGATLDEAKQIIGRLRQFAQLIFNEGAWRVGEPIPNQPTLTILAAFNSEYMSADMDGLDRVVGDCRFYAIPTGGITDPLAPVFCCFTLNRSFPAASGEQMTLETFVREVGREWYNLAVVQGQVEEGERLTRAEWEELDEEEEEEEES